MAKIREATAKIVAPKYRRKSDGTLPIYLRVTFAREKKEYSLKTFTVIEDSWNDKASRYTTNTRLNKEQNIKLNAIETKANEIIKDLDEDFTHHRFESLMFADNNYENVSDYLDHLYKEMENENRLGTARTYKNAKDALKSFKSKTIKFKDIDVSFLKKFEIFLKKRGAGQATIGIYMRTIRTAYNRAINDKLVKQEFYPFKEYKIKTAPADKFSLSKEDMLAIINYPAETGTRLKESINYFALSYFSRGMNFVDMCSLTWDKSIINNRIVYERQKTERSSSNPKPISIKISSHIENILNEYKKNYPYILPVFEPGISEKTKRHRLYGRLKKLTEDIRKIAKELNITHADKLTFYVARHTYATVQKFSGVSVDQISESLGHSSINTTRAYLRSFGNEVLDENDKNLV